MPLHKPGNLVKLQVKLVFCFKYGSGVQFTCIFQTAPTTPSEMEAR